MSTSKLIFFIFFHAMYPAALDLLPCEFEQLFGVSAGRSSGRLVQHGCLTCSVTFSNNCACSRLDGSESRSDSPRSLEAASPAWTRKQTIVRIHQQVHQAADPIPIIYLLLSPGRTLSTNNCEHSPLEARAGARSDPDPDPTGNCSATPCPETPSAEPD